MNDQCRNIAAQEEAISQGSSDLLEQAHEENFELLPPYLRAPHLTCRRSLRKLHSMKKANRILTWHLAYHLRHKILCPLFSRILRGIEQTLCIGLDRFALSTDPSEKLSINYLQTGRLNNDQAHILLSCANPSASESASEISSGEDAHVN
ncbi:hypothetical protein O6H91_02G129200 [Diphasiastrum complanatum]|uniref:Uncharacterized protein n=1 Tax=Diphasiastrum complanatum TaxID=34168 RepID=A0ACC2EKR5_DIPCM|nr:hypothetical protein O6H91_02G129200 [Diphasiastrum complanatum]